LNSIPAELQPEVRAGHRALRKGRVSLPGQAYFITTTTLFRRPVFTDTDACRSVARAHCLTWLWRDSKLLAWVLMPDHWHGLVVLGQQDSLATLIGRFKSVTARSIDHDQRINGWLWSRGFHDRALRDDEDVRNVARYLIANPVRARLAKGVGDYPYWDASWLDTYRTKERVALMSAPTAA